MSTDQISTPTGLMFACITEQETAAAETAVCARHLTDFVPQPDAHGDVTDLALHDVSGNDALSCTVCGTVAHELAEEVEHGHLAHPEVTVTITVPATVTLTVTIGGPEAAYYPSVELYGQVTSARVTLGEGEQLDTFHGPAVADAIDRPALEALALETARTGIIPAPYWS